jgi:hypothetical protein
MGQEYRTPLRKLPVSVGRTLREKRRIFCFTGQQRGRAGGAMLDERSQGLLEGPSRSQEKRKFRSVCKGVHMRRFVKMIALTVRAIASN